MQTCLNCGRKVNSDRPVIAACRGGMLCKFGEGPDIPSPPAIRLPVPDCIHRGAQVDERKCKLCGERGVIRPVFACAVHGECTERAWAVGQKEAKCDICQDAKEI